MFRKFFPILLNAIVVFGLHQETTSLYIPGVPEAVSDAFFSLFTPEKSDQEAQEDATTFINSVADKDVQTSLRDFMRKRSEARALRKAKMDSVLANLPISEKTRAILQKMDAVRAGSQIGEEKIEEIHLLYKEADKDPETKSDMEKVKLAIKEVFLTVDGVKN